MSGMTHQQGWQCFNINDKVKVRLTETGKKILQDNRRELNRRIKECGGEGLGELEIEVDDEGFTECQLWVLMQTFGKHIMMGCDLPFGTNILLQDCECQCAEEGDNGKM